MILVTGRSLNVATNLVGYTGYIYQGTRNASTGAVTFTALTIPAGISTSISRPSFTAFPGSQNRTLITGMFAPGAVVLENYSVNQPGLPAPTSAPTIAAGAGTGLTGTYIGYVTYAHKIKGVIVAESNASPGSNTLVLANQNRSWTGIPTTCPNPRATHVRLYVSVAGASAKFAAEYAIGSSTATENIADGSLIETISARRGVPPYTYYAESYHNRVYFAGDPQYPDRVWFSELNEPESVHSTNYVATRSGEAVTGLRMVRDQLFVTCLNSAYVIRGWTADDIVMEKVSPSVGCIASHSLVNLDEVAIFLSSQGLMAFDGQMKPLMETSLSEYFRDDYNDNTALYRDSFGYVDRETKCYMLLIPKATGFRYVAHYRPMVALGELEPWYGFDTRGRKDYTAGIIAGYSYTGSVDGYVRQENVMTDGDDDGDSAAKLVLIQSRHEMPDEGGREHQGYRWQSVDAFIKSEDDDYVIALYPGEEFAIGDDRLVASAAPAYQVTVDAGAVTGFPSKNHSFVIPPDVSGQGLTINFRWNSPTYVTFRGYGLEWSEGVSARLPLS